MNKKPADIETVAFRARDMQPDERQAFVKQYCNDDVTQISQVYELIKTIARSADEESTADAADESPEPEWQPSILIGSRVGAYELTRLIGHGGMGAVFLAQRMDAEFQQKVAVKLVRNTLLSANISARLRAERQILASLQHPNIAMLHDGGTAPDGTPFLVMEYVDGMTIDAYCDREKLTVEQRLRMFLKVCSAVQCAHQNLIVHRDLKPTNILVTHDGQPKLLDFGIAKLLDNQLQQRHANLTQQDLRMLTPAHASPEQILGDVITTSSDIYVLGLLLYELLCGRKPFTFPQKYRLIDLEQIVCTSRALSPSAMVSRVEKESAGFMQDLARCRGVTTARLKRTLKGDLDNIVMMAMRREPSRRYGSVEQLSNDIKNWLDGLPVIATRDSWSYRASKFARRYAWAIGGLSLTMVAFIVFTFALIVQSYQTTQQRDALERERNRAEQVSSFLLDLFKFSDPTKTRGNELKARELLDAGATRIDHSLDSQPALRATMLDTIGQVYANMGLDTEAAAALEKALKAKIAAYGENNTEVAEVLVHLAEVRANHGDDSAAVELLNRALHIQQQILGDNSIEQADTYRVLAKASMNQGDFAAAESHVLHALSIYDSHGQHDSQQKAVTLAVLGDLRSNLYQDAEAESLYRAALVLLTPTLGAEHPQIMDIKSNLADVLESQGKFSEAQPIFEQALAEKQKTLGMDHPQTISALENYGSFLSHKGDYQSAQRVLEQVLAANIRLHGEQHSYVGYDRVNLGILEYMRGHYREAELQHRMALSIYAQTLPPDHVYVAGAKMSLGRALVQLNKPIEAIPLLEDSVKIFTASLGNNNPMTNRSIAALGIALVAAHQYDKARPLLIAMRPYIENMGDRPEFRREFLDALATVKQ